MHLGGRTSHAQNSESHSEFRATAELSGEPVPGESAVHALSASVVWAFYLAVVCEILFMISPAGIFFYSGFGPLLNMLRRNRGTAWLTTFFLPHFSDTANPVLNAIPTVGGALVMLGATLFLAGFLPIYWSKLRGNGPVVWGPYRAVRHPQYAALSVLGLGTVLLWPRFLALVAWVIMLFVYDWLAHVEEARCLRRFGASYQHHLDRTGRYLPRAATAWLPFLPKSAIPGWASRLVLCGVCLVAALVTAFNVRDCSLARVSAVWTSDTAVLSPARLTPEQLMKVASLAIEHPRVLAALPDDTARLIVYVVPESWGLPDLPLDEHPWTTRWGGHRTPRDFDRNRYKVLLIVPKMCDPNATGADIIKKTHGGQPIMVAHVDTEANAAIEFARPPRHVEWGDIPTPLF